MREFKSVELELIRVPKRGPWSPDVLAVEAAAPFISRSGH